MKDCCLLLILLILQVQPALATSAAAVPALPTEPADSQTSDSDELRRKILAPWLSRREAKKQEPGSKKVSPQKLYEDVWLKVRAYYYDRTFNDQNWETWRHKYDSRMRTLSDAHLAVDTMLESLDSGQNRDLIGIKGSLKQEELSVTRLPHDITYVSVGSLDWPPLVQELNRALEQERERSAMILDLRQAWGGSNITVVQSVAGAFVGRDKVVAVTVDSDGYTDRERTTAEMIWSQPLVVLIDRQTRSGAATLAAALQENGRTKLIGERPPQPHMISAESPLDDGSKLYIPIARLLTPNGADFIDGGPAPDVVVSVSAADREAGRGAWWGEKDVHNRNPKLLHDIQLETACKALFRTIGTH